MRSREKFWRRPFSGWMNRFWPIFLVLPVMLLKTQRFEKELFPPSFLVLCSIKNLSEQFITTHIVSWRFFCIIKLHFSRTYEADGKFFWKNAIFLMILTCFLSYYWVTRHQEAIPLAQKRFKQVLCKLQDHFCNNWLNAENKNFRKIVTFPVKKKQFYIFSRNAEFCRRPQQFYHAPQSTQANLVQVNRSILKDLISCWKRSILKKKTKRQKF